MFFMVDCWKQHLKFTECCYKLCNFDLLLVVVMATFAYVGKKIENWSKTVDTICTVM